MRKYYYCDICNAPIDKGWLCCGRLWCLTKKRPNFKNQQLLEKINEFFWKSPVRFAKEISRPLIKENSSVTLPVVSETTNLTLKKEISSNNLKERLPLICNIVKPKKSYEKYCLYCGNKFGSIVVFHGKTRILALNKDHFIPIHRRRGTKIPDNISLARQRLISSCQICNAIKGSNHFDSFIDAKHFILDNLLKSDWKLLI